MKTAEDILKEKDRDMITVSPDTPLNAAIKLMVENKIGAMLVSENERIVGIWTERDLVCNAASGDVDFSAARIGDHMTKKLIAAKHDDTVYTLLDKMVGLRMRHLLIEKNGKYIGMLSAGDASRATLEAKNKELKQLNEYASWEYYDNWRWNG